MICDHCGATASTEPCQCWPERRRALLRTWHVAVQQLVEAIGQYNEQHGDLPLPTPINEKTADIRAAKQAMRDAEAVLDALTGTRYPWHE